MNQPLYVSPLAEVTLLADGKIAMSVLGRRHTVDDQAGLLQTLLKLAAQGYTADALTALLAARYPAQAVQAAIEALRTSHVLVADDARSRADGDATDQHLRHRRALEALIAQDQLAAYERSNWQVLLAGEGALADAIAAALRQLHVEPQRIAREHALPAATESPTARSLLLVCADFEDHASFRVRNAQALALGLPSLYLSMDWHIVQCGPLVIPGASACYECYFHRLRSTRQFVTEFDARSDADNMLYHALPSRLAIQFGVAEATRLALHYLSGTLELLHHSVFCEIDSVSGEIHRSRLLRLPRCACCGRASAARPVGTVFQQALLRRRA